MPFDPTNKNMVIYIYNMVYVAWPEKKNLFNMVDIIQ